MSKAEKRTSRIISNSLKYLVLIIMSVIVVFPFYILIIESLHPNLISLPYPIEFWPSDISLSNYAYAFNEYPILKWISNSLVISVGTSLFQVILCSMAAYGLQRVYWRGRTVVKWFLMLMLVIPIQSRIIPLFILMSDMNLLNTFFAWIPFLADAFGIYLLMQFMEGIPMELDEAACIDGANLWTTYSRVIVPQTRPAMVVLVTFNFINQWNDFLYPLIMTRNNSMYTLQLGLSNIFSSAQRGEGGGMGVALAGAVISFVPTLLIFLIFQKQIISGMNIQAGVKG